MNNWITLKFCSGACIYLQIYYEHCITTEWNGDTFAPTHLQFLVKNWAKFP